MLHATRLVRRPVYYGFIPLTVMIYALARESSAALGTNAIKGVPSWYKYVIVFGIASCVRQLCADPRSVRQCDCATNERSLSHAPGLVNLISVYFKIYTVYTPHLYLTHPFTRTEESSPFR